MSVGLVAIGRNEGERLQRCLRSARAQAVSAIVYVDSGSTDGSADWARAFGAEVVELDMSRPFTAARSRNAGVRRLLEVAPGTRHIQFVDGDCELQPSWIQAALEALHARPRVAAVCGRLRERFPEATPYNRLCDLEWAAPVGVTDACGGIAMVRREAFEQVGGFREAMIAGEEPDMCFRMRQAGWTILRIADEMALHDAAMTRFGQWWRRNVRAGHAFAEGHFRNGGPPEHYWRRNVVSNFAWAAAFPLLPLLYLKLLLRERDELLARFTALSKLPQALGQLQFHWNRLRGRYAGLIEYK
jgi:GT2 family glycosyltransferase